LTKSGKPDFPLAEDRPVFFYDLGSPYSWLAAERVNSELPAVPVWRPILLGGLFKALGRQSWATSDAREDGMREVERRAAEYGLPEIRWPDPWPGNTLIAMRTATYATGIGKGVAFALAAFRQAFVGGRDLSEPDSVMIAAAACELHPHAVEKAVRQQTVKDALKDATADALARGVVGVPSVAIGEQVFWGDDRLSEAARALM
jgi:2-hydroxychromene-2-carboxylate isomerase